MITTAYNGRFGTMAAVIPQTILCKLERYSPAASSVEAATAPSRWDVIGNPEDRATVKTIKNKLIMRNITILFFLTLNTVQVFANVNYIDISKISSEKKLVEAFNFVRDNQQYYNHWTAEWNYDISKENLINQLREYYKDFSALPKKNAETYLLLGDIAHYLYNMDDSEYYNSAVKNYDEAIKNNPKDFRAYWFLAYHYSLSNVPISAIDNFKKAEEILPIKEPADFWNDYAWATAIANMPSHCIYAMDKVKNISGEEGRFQQQLGETIYKRIVPVDKKQSYDKKDIWTAIQGDKTTFTSRPLGIKIPIDTTWNLSIYDYQNNQAVFIIEPTTIANKAGKEIGYTIAIMMKTVDDNDKLDDYVNKFVSKDPNRKKIKFSDKYDKIVTYEITDKTMYEDMGGGHLYMVGIERNEPKYPGLLLENPITLPKNTDEINYYRAAESKDRFKGKIFYLIIFDSCEDIYKQSFSVFKSFFDNQIIIE